MLMSEPGGLWALHVVDVLDVAAFRGCPLIDMSTGSWYLRVWCSVVPRWEAVSLEIVVVVIDVVILPVIVVVVMSCELLFRVVTSFWFGTPRLSGRVFT